MKLLRLKITDPAGFRSLPCGFEFHFQNARTLHDDLTKPEGFAPFVCAGRNGSGKSNLLEVLAAIFFQLDILRVRRSFLPEALQENIDFSPTAFELDYQIKVPEQYKRSDSPEFAEVNVWKNSGERVRFLWGNQSVFDAGDMSEFFEGGYADILLPEYVLGYSSGENETLSLPFFKIQFLQYDEYLNALKNRLPYFGKPGARLTYLNSNLSQVIFLCTLLFSDAITLELFRDAVGIGDIKEFRIIIRSDVDITAEEAADYGNENSAVFFDSETGRYTVNLLHLLEIDEEQREKARHEEGISLIDLDKYITIIDRLKNCATCTYMDEQNHKLYLDYYVNDATKRAFRENFRGLDENGDPALALFHALQVLTMLNLYSVSDNQKNNLYRSNSHYLSETVPTLASDQRIIRFESVYFSKKGVAQFLTLKELSDGEHQLLHSLGLCLLFRNTNSLFLLDEPETHFNPDWRANFITRLRQCLTNSKDKSQEMLITTHTPFLISDSKPDKVLVFNKDERGKVSISRPEYNTLGASINLITMETFDKQETIGEYAKQQLDDLLSDPSAKTDPHGLAKRIIQTLGDSIERTLAVQSILAGKSSAPKVEPD